METNQQILVKNMVCNRCVMVVDQLVRQAGLTPAVVSLGEVTFAGSAPTKGQLSQLDGLLTQHGFERIDDKKSQLLEQIKTTIIDAIHHHDHFEMSMNWSHVLSEKFHYEYNYLSQLFSSVAGISLEQYIIKQKIEKVKEYLFYDELSVKEIAFRMGYSSVAHLSTQFKKVTGLTPTDFKQARESQPRKPLDKIM